MALPPEIDRNFPTKEHWESVKKKVSEHLTLTDPEMRAWQNYNYGWRRVMLQTRDDQLPTDPERKWFNAELAARAEIFFSKLFNRRAPDLPGEAPASKPARVESPREEIARVYRQRYSEGRPFPPGLPDDHPDVEAAVNEDRERRARLEREMEEKRRQLSHDEYHDWQMQQIRANLREFFERGQWVKKMPDGSTIEDPKDELARIRDELGVKASERGFVDTDKLEQGASFMITNAQKAALKTRGFTEEQIRNMKPEEAHRILQRN
jgi:hypothetical protein